MLSLFPRPNVPLSLFLPSSLPPFVSAVLLSRPSPLFPRLSVRLFPLVPMSLSLVPLRSRPAMNEGRLGKLQSVSDYKVESVISSGCSHDLLLTEGKLKARLSLFSLSLSLSLWRSLGRKINIFSSVSQIQ